MIYINKLIYGVMYCYVSIWLTIGVARQQWVKILQQKGESRLSRRVITRYAIKTRGRGWTHSSTVLDLGTRWTVVASCPGRFTPRVYWIKGWVGPIAGLYAVKKILLPLPGMEYHRQCSPSHIAIPTALPQEDSGTHFCWEDESTPGP
jgi:hypothetical protein